jgi:hypothetical protein
MSYTAQHTMLEALVNALLLIQPCAEINLVQSPAYEVQGLKGGGAYWTVECVRPQSAEYAGTILTFIPPRLREDGTVLEDSEVTHYKIDFDKRCVYAISASGESRGECY